MLPFRKRQAACGSLTSYCFDLDGDESEERELAHEKFTVDSRLHGMHLLSVKIHILLNHFNRELDSIHQVCSISYPLFSVSLITGPQSFMFSEFSNIPCCA